MHMTGQAHYYHSWTLFLCDTLTAVLFVKVSEHASTLKYRDKSIGSSSTCFLQTVTVPLYNA